MKTEYEKMISGEMYEAFRDPKLVEMRTEVRKIFREFNRTADQKMLEDVFKQKLDGVFIEPPFHCDYGVNIELGKNVYMNFGVTILDCAKVKIGDNCMLAPNVQIYTAAHPLDVETRNKGLEYALPVTIGKNCWIGGSVVILPGVTIGDNCVIGAGSVVNKDIPPNSVAVGNPAKVKKVIDNGQNKNN
ncbi:MAG: sugar O-acetyltransferase [Candidatus Gastranaerophilaceae bacterium]